MSFKSGMSYALKDPTRYDDEHGEGYGRVEVLEGGEGMFITDCWVTNDAGEVHPGYAESPVPIQFQDVEPQGMRPGSNGERERSKLLWA